jgi:hypothetical protein
MNPQPDEWTKKLTDDRMVVYTSNLGSPLSGVGGGVITAQVGDIKHTEIATHPMTRQEIEAIFAGILAK